MLEIYNLRVTYGRKKVLNGINLTLEKGETLGIIGESGVGKTTLGLSIMGLLGETDEAEVEGDIVFDGKNLRELSKEEIRRIRLNRIAMVFQNEGGVLDPVYTISDQIKEPMLEDGSSKKQAEERALFLMGAVGIPQHCFSHYPHQLSGGELQRALIAMALANDPEVIILDEPLSSLDTIAKEGIIKVIRQLCRDKTLLVITHDISTAAKLTEEIAVLYGGRIVEKAPSHALISEPRHPYTRGLLRSYPNMTTTKDLQGIRGRLQGINVGCPFHPRCTQKLAVCKEEMPCLKRYDERYLACHRGGIIRLLETKNLTKSFGSFKAVDSVDLTLYEGETLGLVGESGSGKTTLAKTIMGLLESTSGNIYIECEEADPRKRDFSCKVQMIFQNPRDSISHRLNILQAVREPLEIHKIGTKGDRTLKVKSVLEEVGLASDDEFLEKYPHQLSGGEVQRVAIARALVLNPKLLIADEPTSALDASIQAKIMRLFNNLQENRGLGILFISHDLALIRKISDHIAIMSSGKIIEQGPSYRVVHSPLHEYTKELLNAAPSLDTGLDKKGG
jgi:peptide/nickel transport system ATP-binding protein